MPFGHTGTSPGTTWRPIVRHSSTQRSWFPRGGRKQKWTLLLSWWLFIFVLFSFVYRQFETPTIEIVTSISPKFDEEVKIKSLGAVVFLAPRRNSGSIWAIDRFCFLLRAVRSVDQYLNTKYGPYPIFILLAKDYQNDKDDGRYTDQDRRLIKSWAPHSKIYFVEIDMYSNQAITTSSSSNIQNGDSEIIITREQIIQWRAGKDGGIAGRDLGYQSMCRLWSGRLQSMPFLDGITYYMRMDDDSLLTREFPYDPFKRLQSRGLTYAYRRQSYEPWGVRQLWKVSKPHVLENKSSQQVKELPFLTTSVIHQGEEGGDDDEDKEEYTYTGGQPYNNFHLSEVSFWRSESWMKLWQDMNNNHLFFKYRVGDASVHAIALMMIGRNRYEEWSDVPYVHNSNDDPGWGKKIWKEECDRAIKEMK